MEQQSHTPSVSEAARAYATQRLDINSLHHANNHAVDASIHLQNMQAHSAPPSITDAARTGLQVALENQYQAWQRAYLTSTENELALSSIPYDGPAEEILRRAIRLGIEYLEAEDHLASSRPESEQPGQETAIQRRDRALQGYQATAALANVAIGLPPHNTSRLAAPEQRGGGREARHRRRAMAAFAAAAAAGAADPIPVLGHGPNVRPLAAGVLAAIVPHLWIMFKLAILIYAFTRMNNSWGKIVMICMVSLGIFLYNAGVLEPLWTRLSEHLHRLLPLADVPPPQRIENGVIMPRGAPAAGDAQGAGQPAATGNDANAAQVDGAPRRRRAAEPTPEQYAERILAHQQQEARNRTQATRSRRYEAFRMIERDFLLFFMSFIPGIAERHIAAIKAENRARERAQEREDRERDENAEQEQERRDGREVDDRRAGEGAVGAAALQGARQEAEENRAGAGQRLGGDAPRPAAVEDVFGGVD